MVTSNMPENGLRTWTKVLVSWLVQFSSGGCRGLNKPLQLKIVGGSQKFAQSYFTTRPNECSHLVVKWNIPDLDLFVRNVVVVTLLIRDIPGIHVPVLQHPPN